VTFSPHQVFRPTGGGDFQSSPGCFADLRPRLCVLTRPQITIDCLRLAECNCDLQSLPGCISDRLTGGRDSNTRPAVSMLTTIFGGFALPFLRPCPVMRDALSTLVGAIGSRPSALDTIPGPVHPVRPVRPFIGPWPINHARVPKYWALAIQPCPSAPGYWPLAVRPRPSAQIRPGFWIPGCPRLSLLSARRPWTLNPAVSLLRWW
jgi:hypothetical protein